MEPSYPLIVAAPLIGAAVYCVTQVSAARLIPRRSPYMSLAAGMLAGLIVTMTVSASAVTQASFTKADRVGYMLLNAASYLALAWCYFNFVNVTIASLRVRLLGELREAGRPIPRTALLQGYNSAKVVDIRIDRLVQGGHLVERDGLYFLGKRRFLMVARVYNCLRKAIIGPWPDDHWPVPGR